MTLVLHENQDPLALIFSLELPKLLFVLFVKFYSRAKIQGSVTWNDRIHIFFTLDTHIFSNRHHRKIIIYAFGYSLQKLKPYFSHQDP